MNLLYSILLFYLIETPLFNIIGEKYIYIRYLPELIIIFFFVGVIISNQKWKLTGFEFPLLILVLIIFISTLINNINPLVTILEIRTYCRYILVFLIITQLKPLSYTELRYFMNFIIFLGVFQMFIGFIQYFNINIINVFLEPVNLEIGSYYRERSGTYSSGTRLSGTLVRYSVYGTFLNIIFSFIYSKIKIFKDNKSRLYFILLFPILILTFSRKALISLISTYLVVNIKMKEYVKFTFVSILGTVLFLIAITIFGSISFYDTIDANNFFERFMGAFSSSYITHSLEMTRLFIITEGMMEVIKEGFLFGLGPGVMASSGSLNLLGLGINEYITFDRRYIFINDVGIIFIFSQIGILGLLALGYIIKKTYNYSINIYNHSNIPIEKCLSLVLIGTIPVILITNITAFSLSYRPVALLYWMLAGIICNINMRYK